MADQDRLTNIKGLFQNSRTRTIVIFTAALVVLFIVIGIVSLRTRIEGPATEAKVSVGGPGSIASIPGGLEVSEEYAKLQERANILRAEKARTTGESAIPTITSATELGAGGLAEKGITKPVAEGIGFHELLKSEAGGEKKSLWLDDLKKAGCTPDAIKKAMSLGATSQDIAEAGCSDESLMVLPTGFSLDELTKGGCSVDALKKAKALGVAAQIIKQKLGCTAAQMRAGGYTLDELVSAGFSAKDLHDLGFGAADLKGAGFSDDDLRKVGYSAQELLDAGITPMAVDVGPIVPTSQIISQIPTTSQTSEDQLSKIMQQQQAQVSSQKLDQMRQQLQTAMSTQAGQLFTDWAITDQIYVKGVEEKNGKKTGPGAKGSSTTGSGESTQLKHNLFKAGDIVFAVLETAVNSDEPGPVMATVVEGKFKGATLVGGLQTFGQYGQKVQLNFDQMSIKGYPSSIGVNAVAIDPKTARTALSNNTDNHYLLRYGSLFASAFLDGYGQAALNSGSTTTTQSDGSTTKQTADFTPKDKLTIALGTVGQRWGQQLAPIFNTPATVHVYAGVGLGVLFLKDVADPLQENI